MISGWSNGDGKYNDMWLETSRTQLWFRVKANNTAKIALSHRTTETNSNTYEIEIGGEQNTKVSIRRYCHMPFIASWKYLLLFLILYILYKYFNLTYI